MKSKLILLATAAMLVATNAQAAFLSRESQRCASPRPLGIFKPRNAADNTVSSNCDVAANRVADPVAQAKQPYQPITAPGMLIGVPHDTVTPLVQKEIDTATKQDPASLPAITRDPGLLQYLPEGYFATPYAIAAFNRLIRVEPSYAYPVNFKVLSGRPRTTTAVNGATTLVWTVPGHTWNRSSSVNPASYRILADRLRCLSERGSETVNGITVCKIKDQPDV